MKPHILIQFGSNVTLLRLAINSPVIAMELSL